MRGIRFQIPNEYGVYLGQILHGIAKNFTWAIFDDEIFYADLKPLFQENTYKGDDFNKIISKDKYYIISCNLQAYKSQASQTKITCYSDFIDSQCDMIILIVDSIYIDIYLKDPELTKSVIQNIQMIPIQEIHVITETNDLYTHYNL